LLTWLSASAFPPAPYHTLFGLVRNQRGEPLNVAGAEISLETSNGPGVTTPLSPGLEPGVNYELLLPIEMAVHFAQVGEPAQSASGPVHRFRKRRRPKRRV